MKTFIIVLVLAVIAVGGFVMFGREARSPGADIADIPVVSETGMIENGEKRLETTGTTEASDQPTAVVSVLYTDSGYAPARVEINAGDTVTFVNHASADSWPATNIHPMHMLYPGSDIKKCFDGSGGSGLFDSCRGLKTSEAWSFTFTEKGEWEYHDHLHPSDTGVVVVK